MKEKYITKGCKYHGETEFILEPSRNSYRCKKCRSNNVSKRRRKVKEKLVNVFGGKCILCNYSKYIGALDFHHLNPNEKEYGLGGKGLTKGYKTLLEEAKKCILLCANCHREVESGIVTIDDKKLNKNKKFIENTK
jgi:5-methylcytosine-specific restriction endonuclease McrA